MTEEEWLTCEDVERMTDIGPGRVSERKLILFGCACCCRQWAIIPDGCCRTAIDTAQSFADGGCDSAELRSAREQVRREYPNLFWYQESGCHAEAASYYAAFDSIAAREMEAAHPLGRPGDYLFILKCLEVACLIATAIHKPIHGAWNDEVDAWKADIAALKATWVREVAAQCALLRHIIGNPFRPYPAPDHWPSNVIQLANAVYQGEDCGFALHDALLEAGHPELADHFRQEQSHPKGCWVVDMVLGKE